MPIFNRVSPGDLITAEEWNDVLDTLESFGERLHALEASLVDNNTVIITELEPAGTESEPIRPNEQLRIHGYNFRFSIGAQHVTLNGTVISNYDVLQSDDELLVVTTPGFSGLPTTGQEMELQVFNGVTSATRTVLVRPREVPLTGDVDVLWDDTRSRNPTPNPIPPNQTGTTFQFHYRLRSRASASGDFLVNPTVSISAWQDSVQALNESGQVIANRRITLAPLEERQFSVQIGPVTTGPLGTPFNLLVSSSAGTVHNSSSRDIEVGVPVPVEDPTITLALTGHEVFVAADGSPDPTGGSYNDGTNTISVRPGRQLFMYYQVTLGEPGNYQVTVTPGPNTSGWDMVASPPEYDEPSGNVNETPLFAVTPTADAAATGSVTFRIGREGLEAAQTRRYNLILLDTNGG